eukprot:5478352-Prymnesium_polylepis.1
MPPRPQRARSPTTHAPRGVTLHPHPTCSQRLELPVDSFENEAPPLVGQLSYPITRSKGTKSLSELSRTAKVNPAPESPEVASVATGQERSKNACGTWCAPFSHSQMQVDG